MISGKMYETIDALKEVDIVITPCPTRCCVVKGIMNQAYMVDSFDTKNSSKTEMINHIPLQNDNLNYLVVVTEGDTLKKTVTDVQKADDLCVGDKDDSESDIKDDEKEIYSQSNGIGVTVFL